MTKGGIDPGVFGYYATLVNQPLAIAKATAATVFAAEDYDPPPVTVEGTPQPALTEHEVSRGKYMPEGPWATIEDARSARPVAGRRGHRRRHPDPAAGGRLRRDSAVRAGRVGRTLTRRLARYGLANVMQARERWQSFPP